MQKGHFLTDIVTSWFLKFFMKVISLANSKEEITSLAHTTYLKSHTSSTNYSCWNSGVFFSKVEREKRKSTADFFSGFSGAFGILVSQKTIEQLLLDKTLRTSF